MWSQILTDWIFLLQCTLIISLFFFPQDSKSTIFVQHELLFKARIEFFFCSDIGRVSFFVNEDKKTITEIVSTSSKTFFRFLFFMQIMQRSKLRREKAICFILLLVCLKQVYFETRHRPPPVSSRTPYLPDSDGILIAVGRIFVYSKKRSKFIVVVVMFTSTLKSCILWRFRKKLEWRALFTVKHILFMHSNYGCLYKTMQIPVKLFFTRAENTILHIQKITQLGKRIHAATFPNYALCSVFFFL